MVSKSAKIHAAVASVLVVFPLLVALLMSTSAAVIAVVLIGVGGYGFAVCLLVAGFWHRYRYGVWPFEFGDEPTGLRQEDSRGASHENRGLFYRAHQVLLAWLSKNFSNV